VEVVLAALIAGLFGVGGPIAYFLSRLDKRNTSQHGENLGAMRELQVEMRETRVAVERVDQKVDLAAERLSEHLAFHAHQAPTPSVQTVVVTPQKEHAA
jgi:hypothetical protein